MKNTSIIVIAVLMVTMTSGAGFAGTILGKVIVKGTPQSLEGLGLGKAEATRARHSLVVSDKGALANTVVYVNHDFATVPTPEGQSIVVDQKEETYVPHVAAAMRGARIEFMNSDRILHNVHTFLNGKSWFNRAMPLFGQRTSKRLDETGVVRVACDVHKHMQAYVRVLTNPYFATTNAGGLFVIRDVPAGKYELRVWHERLPQERAKSIEVTADGKTPVVFEIPAEELKLRPVVR